MNILQHPDAINSQNLQIWNNAAFDAAAAAAAAAGTDRLGAKVSWCPLQPISTNRFETLDVDSCKENRSPGFPKSPVSKKSQPPIKSLRPKVEPGKPSKVSWKQGDEVSEDGDLDDGRVDAEIEEIEKEIRRLSSRLEELLIKKRESRAAVDGRRGRIVPAKFLDPKQSSMKEFETPDKRKVKESPASLKIRPSGTGAGPKRILGKNLDASNLRKIEESPASAKFQRRGASLGPMEIHNSIKYQKLESPGCTPLSVQSRRKSCFLKLEGIEEEKGVRRLCSSPKSRPSIAKPRPITEDRSKKIAESPADPARARIRQRGISLGPSEIISITQFRHPRKQLQESKERTVKNEKDRSLSVSPKSRPRSKISDLRKGIATVGAKKTVKGEFGSLTSLKPKVLFQEAKDPVSSKRPSKSTKARVVASRYSLAPGRVAGDDQGNKRRKWSLPETGKDETDRAENKCSLSLGGTPVSMLESSRNRGSEISSMVEDEESHHRSPSVMEIAEALPKIRTIRCIIESPRDSGCAKRVAELVGRKQYFAEEGEASSTSPCQTLIFEEEEQ